MLVSNAQDAEQVRNSCTTIGGDLVFGPTLSESINLDGVETVRGSICHSADPHGSDGVIEPFNISSSTLTQLDGDIDFWFFHGLERLAWPNLERVTEAPSTIYRSKSTRAFRLRGAHTEKVSLDEKPRRLCLCVSGQERNPGSRG